MRLLIAIIAIVLMLPVLLVIAIALGPAALGILFVLGCTALVLSVGRVASRLSHRTRVPPLHG